MAMNGSSGRSRSVSSASHAPRQPMPLPTPPALAHHAQSKCTLPALQVLEVLEFWLLHRYQAGVHHVLGAAIPLLETLKAAHEHAAAAGAALVRGD